MGTEADFTDAGQRGKPVFCPVSKMRGPHAESVRVRRSGDFVLEQARSHEEVQKEKEMKELIKNLRKTNKEVDHNIFKSLDNVNLNCVLGTKKDGNYESFLDHYD